MTPEENEQFVLETTEGLLTLFQTLVVALAKSGHLDTAELARLILSMRQHKGVDPESFEDMLYQRALSLLVEGDPQVLVRRWEMHAVPIEPTPDPGAETDPPPRGA